MPVPPQVVHDTLRVLVHDTTAVRDTIVRVAAPDLQPHFFGITLPVFLGWLVTVGGFFWAARIASQGWKKSAELARDSSKATAQAALDAQKERRRLDDELARKILKEAIHEGLGMAIMLLRDIIDIRKKHATVPNDIIGHLTESRAAYERNKDNMVLWEDAAQKERIQTWFRENQILLVYLGQPEKPKRKDQTDEQYRRYVEESVRLEVIALEKQLKQARDLFVELDFKRINPGDPGYEEWAGRSVTLPLEP